MPAVVLISEGPGRGFVPAPPTRDYKKDYENLRARVQSHLARIVFYDPHGGNSWVEGEKGFMDKANEKLKEWGFDE